MGIKSWFVKPSTQAFVEEAKKIQGYSFFDLLHGYIYARGPISILGLAQASIHYPKPLRPSPVLSTG